MNLEKLKDTARKLEQKEDWRKAIEVYLKAIQQAESGADTAPDLSLYNRVGDLYLKINDTAEAVRSYERAVDLYADQGFFNNAIDRVPRAHERAGATGPGISGRQTLRRPVFRKSGDP
jgi:tetratricopeptide (TPR) repeat protein